MSVFSTVQNILRQYEVRSGSSNLSTVYRLPGFWSVLNSRLNCISDLDSTLENVKLLRIECDT